MVRSRLFKGLAAALLLVLVLAVALFINVWFFKPITIDAFYTRSFAKVALDRPELLSQLRVLPSWLDFYSDKLDDASPAHDRKEAAALRENLETLHRYDRNAIDREGRLSYDTLDYFLRTQVEGDPYWLHNFPVNQLFGVQSTLPIFMAQVHQVKSTGEGDNYVTRLNAFPKKFDQVLESLELRENRNLMPPRFVVDKVIAQMQGFVAAPSKENLLFTSLKEKLDKLPADVIDAATRERLLAQTDNAIRASVYPSYRKLIDYFVALRPKAQSNEGAWHLPDGDAFYAWCVRQQTTTDLTPQQVHELGLAEVARVGAELDELLKSLGMREGSVGARLQKISHDPAQVYPDTAEGRQALLARYQAILDEANRGLGKAFDVRPKLGVEVKAVPAALQAGAATAFYAAGSLDGSRPGIFYVNLRDVGDSPKFEMRNEAFHEGIPGHHFQITVAQERQDLPLFRKVIPLTAYVEGWALYAERLAFELGLEHEPLDGVGRLLWDMMRSVRLVVDSGIHYKHWTREQAIDYMMEKTGKDEAFVTAEIERYFVNPGQALSYKVGALKILALREKARLALGAKFDLAQFHDEVLTHGSLPLVLLERVIDDWIEKRKAA